MINNIMKDKIPEALKKYLEENKRKKVTLFSQEIQEFMMEYAKFYNWNITNLYKIFNLMKQGISELDICENPSCSNKKKIIWDGTITKGCSKKCNTIITKLEKYGVEHHMQLNKYKKFGDDNIFSNGEYIHEKFKEKYGVAAPINVPEFREKIKETNLKKYGNKWNIASEYSRDKQKQTCLERYGVDNYVKMNYGDNNYMRSLSFKARKDEIREKIEATSLKRYGTKHPMQSDYCKNKYKETSIKNHGIPYPGVLNKYKIKEYTWATGEVSYLQGYEPIVLKELEESGLDYNDIKVGFNEVPTFKYEYNGEEHEYFPDFYIPSQNLIIEVKSEWTLQKEFDKNQAKFNAVKDAGFEFKLEIR